MENHISLEEENIIKTLNDEYNELVSEKDILNDKISEICNKLNKIDSDITLMKHGDIMVERWFMYGGNLYYSFCSGGNVQKYSNYILFNMSENKNYDPRPMFHLPFRGFKINGCDLDVKTTWNHNDEKHLEVIESMRGGNCRWDDENKLVNLIVNRTYFKFVSEEEANEWFKERVSSLIIDKTSSNFNFFDILGAMIKKYDKFGFHLNKIKEDCRKELMEKLGDYGK